MNPATFGGGGGSYDLSATSGAGGSDTLGNAGPVFGDYYGTAPSGASISTPVLIAGLAVIGLLIWSRK